MLNTQLVSIQNMSYLGSYASTTIHHSSNANNKMAANGPQDVTLRLCHGESNSISQENIEIVYLKAQFNSSDTYVKQLRETVSNSANTL